MREKRNRFLIGLAAAVLLISAVKPAFDALGIYPDQTQEGDVKIQLHMEEYESAELRAEDTARSSPYVENSGKEACYVRVKIDLPMLDGREVLELGKNSKDGFSPLSFLTGESRDTEYWEIKEDYIYYRNRLTDNRLMPGRTTPPVYEAVRFSPEMTDTGVTESEQSCIVYAQAAGAEGGMENEVWKR